MQEPTPHDSRIALAGAIAAMIVVGGGGFLLGRGTNERPPAVVTAAPAATPVPVIEPERGVLDRADLIALAATAADAVAGGAEAAAEIAAADGRRFELRLPFGCSGPATADSTAAMRWSYDAKDRALRVHVAPVAWRPDEWWGANASSGIGAVEGFWITRPWTANEACPPSGERTATAGTEAVTLPGQTLALGQIFAEDARGGRRDGKPYQAVVRIADGEPDTSLGFRLRLSGRIARVPDGGTVRCRQPAGPEQRPICMIGVLMDEISIENPATDAVLATWNVAPGDMAGN